MNQNWNDSYSIGIFTPLRYIKRGLRILSNHTYNYETYMQEHVKTYFTQVICRGAMKAKFRDVLTDNHRSNLPCPTDEQATALYMSC